MNTISDCKTNEEIFEFVLSNPKEGTEEYFKYCKWLANFLINDLRCLIKRNPEYEEFLLANCPIKSLCIKLAYYVYNKKWLIEYYTRILNLEKLEREKS